MKQDSAIPPISGVSYFVGNTFTGVVVVVLKFSEQVVVSVEG